MTYLKMMNNIFYIVRGIPGSGKTTFVKHLTNLFVEADHFFYDKEGNYTFDANKLHEAHKWCQNEIENMMKMGFYKIAVSNTSTTEKELQVYLDLAKKYNYQVFSVVVENRHGNSNVHGVPEEALNRMENNLRNNLKLR